MGEACKLIGPSYRLNLPKSAINCTTPPLSPTHHHARIASSLQDNMLIRRVMHTVNYKRNGSRSAELSKWPLHALAPLASPVRTSLESTEGSCLLNRKCFKQSGKGRGENGKGNCRGAISFNSRDRNFALNTFRIFPTDTMWRAVLAQVDKLPPVFERKPRQGDVRCSRAECCCITCVHLVNSLDTA